MSNKIIVYNSLQNENRSLQANPENLIHIVKPNPLMDFYKSIHLHEINCKISFYLR